MNKEYKYVRRNDLEWENLEVLWIECLCMYVSMYVLCMYVCTCIRLYVSSECEWNRFSGLLY